MNLPEVMQAGILYLLVPESISIILFCRRMFMRDQCCSTSLSITLVEHLLFPYLWINTFKTIDTIHWSLMNHHPLINPINRFQETRSHWKRGTTSSKALSKLTNKRYMKTKHFWQHIFNYITHANTLNQTRVSRVHIHGQLLKLCLVVLSSVFCLWSGQLSK